MFLCDLVKVEQHLFSNKSPIKIARNILQTTLVFDGGFPVENGVLLPLRYTHVIQPNSIQSMKVIEKEGVTAYNKLVLCIVTWVGGEITNQGPQRSVAVVILEGNRETISE